MLRAARRFTFSYTHCLIMNVMEEVAIVIIGFNRPDFVQLRLKEIQGDVLKTFPLYVAVDGPRINVIDDKKAHESIVKAVNKCQAKNLQIIKRKVNLGCDLHIPTTIDEILMKHKFIIVIEDDVSVNADVILNLANKIIESSQSGLLNPVIGISCLTRNWISRQNAWRKTTYFSAWGFALSREFWSLHKSFQEMNLKRDVEKQLEHSRYWANISSRKKRIWLERFKRGNYDYQIQKTIFARNIEVFAPAYRIISNEGHADSRAMHTKHKKPFYLRSKVADANFQFNNFNVLQKESAMKFFTFVDSNTWAGDGLLSIRGRLFGIRTLVRFLLSRLHLS